VSTPLLPRSGWYRFTIEADHQIVAKTKQLLSCLLKVSHYHVLMLELRNLEACAIDSEYGLGFALLENLPGKL
jgi:hypothetical protein